MFAAGNTSCSLTARSGTDFKSYLTSAVHCHSGSQSDCTHEAGQRHTSRCPHTLHAGEPPCSAPCHITHGQSPGALQEITLSCDAQDQQMNKEGLRNNFGLGLTGLRSVQGNQTKEHAGASETGSKAADVGT